MHLSRILGPAPAGWVIGCCATTMLLAVGITRSVVLWKRSRINPEEVERRRRLALNDTGKLADATLFEFRDDHLFYSYDVRGIEYMASQDVSTLRVLVPGDAALVNGVVFVKYDPRNPANSMLLCEQWSGFRSGGIRTSPSR